MYDLAPHALTHLTLRLGLDTHETPNAPRLAHLLKACPALHTLALRFGYRAFGRADVSGAFRDARLPGLRALVLDDAGADAGAVRAFLSAHPALQTLHLCAAPRFDVACLAPGSPGGEPAVKMLQLRSYAPADAQRLGELGAAGAAPALCEVVLSARQLYLARHEAYREGWARALSAHAGLRRVGMWDPYAEADVKPVVGVLPVGVEVGRETRCPWYYEDLE